MTHHLLRRTRAIAVALWLAVSGAHASNLTLWYNQAGANNITQGLLLGNGRLGAIVPGKVAAENIVLNESSLWSGTANLSGGYDTGPTAPFGAYQLFGNLLINLPAHTSYTAYKRVLDIGTGVATVDYTNNGIAYHRECFCSAPDQVLVVRLTASAPAAYTGSIQLVDGHSNATVSVTSGSMFSGALANGEKYEAQLLAINTGGSLVSSAGAIQFTSCDSLTLVVALGTDYVMDYSRSYHGNDPHSNVVQQVQAAAAKSFATLQAAHTNDFQSLFNRVSLYLGEAPPARTNLPTDQRITANAAKDDDPWMEQLMFQYGRYLMISSSRTGCPMNLQGLWNDSNNPPWASDYHTDINIEMMYWQAEVANLAECAHPLIDFIQSQIPAWRYVTTNASTSINNAGYGYGFGGARGWTLRTSHNINGGMGWEWTEAGNAWYCLHLWEHYAFSGDTNYLLDTAYPILKETCQFWEDHLRPLGPNGQLVVTNGWSPEHGGRENGVSYDQELVWDVFSNYIQASTILGIDASYRATISNLRSNLLVPGIGPWGELREWLYTPDSPTDDHRHTMHLVGLYPGRQFTPRQTPALAAAARVGLLARGDAGDSAYEWAHAWRIALFARLLDAPNAHHKLALYCGTLEPNLVAYYSGSIAQWDGSCGVTAGIGEMLLQSHEGEINLLPALPNAWPAGSVTGLCARRGYVVDITWTNAVASATIKASLPGTCVVRTPKPVAVTRHGLPVAVTNPAPGLTQWPVNAGETFALQWVLPPFPALSPNPTNFAVNVNIGTALNWNSGWTNYQHDVYFGANSNAVLNATTSSPEYLGRFSTTNAALPLLLTNSTCYWRVDEVAGMNIGTGTLWNFTTAGSFNASNPSPAAGQTKVAVNSQLSWTSGVSAGCLHDVYLGTSSNAVYTASTNSPEYQGRVAVPSLTPASALQTNTTYYWRVDELASVGLSVGPVWAFATARDYAHSGLSLYFTMDGRDILNTTNIYDRSGPPFHPGNLLPTANTPAAVAGQIGEALSFNGTNQYVEAAALNLNTANATFLAWVKRSGTQPDWAGLVFSRGTGNRGTGLMVASGSQLRYTWNDTGGDYGWSTGLTLPDGQWALAALVVTPTQAVVYLGTTNGVLTAKTNALANTVAPLNGTIRLANDPNSSTRSFKGAVDEVYIWNRALTAAEIGQMLTNGLTGQTIDGSQTARAGTLTWTGYASAYWTNTANWSTNAAPGASDIAIFDYSSLKNLSTDLGQAQTVVGVSISGPLLNVGIASAGGYPLTLGSAGLALSNTLATVSLGAPVRLSAPQTWSVADSAVLTTTSSVTNAGNLLALSNNNTATFNGVISGSGGFTLSGVGSTTFGVANTYTGPTAINGGRLTVAAFRGLENSPITINSGGVLVAGAVNAFQYYTKSITVKSGGTLTTKDGITSNIGAGGATTTLMLEGGATITSGTPDSSWGSWTFNMGTSLVTVSGGNAAPAVIGALDVTVPSARSPLTFNVSNVTGDASPDLVFSGTLTTKGGANYGITKTGQGTMVLSGVNTYNGVTTVSGGTLQVDGAIGAGAVTLQNTATLAGSGTIGGAVTAQSGATLAPGGARIGILATGAEVWNGGAALAFGLNSATDSAGWDRLSINGALNVQATISSKFVIKLLSLSASNAPAPLANFNKFSSYVWTLATASGGVQNFDALKFAVDTSGFSNDCSGGSFVLDVSGNALMLRYTAPPKVAPRFTDIAALGDGSISLGATGAPAQPYILLTASNLTLPVNWTPSASNYADATGVVTFSDLAVTNDPQRFYRLVSP